MFFLSRFVIVGFVLLFSCLLSTALAEEIVQQSDRVAKVGNLVIKETDVDLRFQKLMPMNKGFHGTASDEKIAEIRQLALDELLDRAYKVQYAINEEISVDAKAFENSWQKKVAQNPQLKDPNFASAISKFKAELYLEALAQVAETVAVDEKLNVTDQEVKASYVENKSMYFRPKLFTVSHVFVKVPPEDNAEEKEAKRVKAEDLFERALSGEDFYNLAYYESDDRTKYVGGLLGSFHSGQMIAELDSAVKEMQVGDVVGPVRSRFGFHVIRLDAVAEERQLEFSEVETTIRERLIAASRKEIYEKWMAELKTKYVLELFD